MKKILFFVFSICAFLSGQVTPTPITKSITNHTRICTLSGISTNDILLIGAHTEGTFTGISDSFSSTLTQVDYNTAIQPKTSVWIGTAASSGSDTITITGTSSFDEISCTTMPAGSITTTVDAHTTGTYTGTPATITSSAITTSVGQDFLYYLVSGFRNAGVLAPAAPLNALVANDGSDSMGVGWTWTGVNGSQTATFNNVTNDQGSYIIVAFKTVSSLTITSSSLPTGALSQSYDAFLTSSGGVGSSYTWSKLSGSLFGLSLNSSTGEISGTPTSGGTSSVNFQVTDGTNTTTKTISLTVNSSAVTPAYVSDCTSGCTVSIGNLIIASTYHFVVSGTINIVPPTDTRGTVYKLVAISESPTTIMLSATWMGTVTSAGADTVSASGSNDFIAGQFSGVQALGDNWASTSGHSASTATLAAPNLTTTAPNSLIYADSQAFTNATTLAVSSPFSSDGSRSGLSDPMLGSYNVEASVGTYAASFTQTSNSNGNWCINTFALRPLGSGIVVTATHHRVLQD